MAEFFLLHHTGCLATSEPYSYDRTIARCVNLIGDSNWSIKFYRVADLRDPFPITAILFLRVIIYFCIYFKYNFLLYSSRFFWSYLYFYLSRFFWIYFYFYSSRKQALHAVHCNHHQRALVRVAGDFAAVDVAGPSASPASRTIFQRALEASQLTWQDPHLQRILRADCCSDADLCDPTRFNSQGLPLWTGALMR